MAVAAAVADEHIPLSCVHRTRPRTLLPFPSLRDIIVASVAATRVFTLVAIAAFTSNTKTTTTTITTTTYPPTFLTCLSIRFEARRTSLPEQITGEGRVPNEDHMIVALAVRHTELFVSELAT